MKIDQVGIQLYTVREHLHTPEDFQESLAKIAEIGYRSVEVCGSPVDPSVIAALCEEKGLVINACHHDPQDLLRNPEAVLQTMETFGCRYVCYPYPAGIELASVAAVDDWIGQLSRAGKVISSTGKVLCYHHHAHEFLKLEGEPVLERILNRIAPGDLSLELDTYWIQTGGGSPESWCRRLSGRVPLVHLKDYQIGPDYRPTFAEIGEGVLGFKAIVAEADAAGCQWFNVEQDVCPGDPFDAIEASFRYIRDHLAD